MKTVRRLLIAILLFLILLMFLLYLSQQFKAIGALIYIKHVEQSQKIDKLESHISELEEKVTQLSKVKAEVKVEENKVKVEAKETSKVEVKDLLVPSDTTTITTTLVMMGTFLKNILIPAY